ncbi:MAG: hypothetical protein FJ109_05200 [Deltaproteobacteria bacterium]|nr:hypothetical protein [Deltaproteobacteria bacterium]
MARDGEFTGPEEDIFLAALDGELNEDEQGRFERNLAEDAGFRERFERYRQTVELIRRLGPRPAPESLLPSVQRRITRRAVDSAGPVLRFPYELLVFVVILGSLFYIYFGMLPPAPTEVSKRAVPATVELELTSPLPAEIVARFELTDPGDSAGGARQYYGRMSRDRAAELFSAVTPFLKDKSPPTLPAANRLGILLTAPLP